MIIVKLISVSYCILARVQDLTNESFQVYTATRKLFHARNNHFYFNLAYFGQIFGSN